jgi:hypothetical protein
MREASMSEVIYVASRSVAVGDPLCYRDSGSRSTHDAVSRKPAGVNPPSGVRMRTVRWGCCLD